MDGDWNDDFLRGTHRIVGEAALHGWRRDGVPIARYTPETEAAEAVATLADVVGSISKCDVVALRGPADLYVHLIAQYSHVLWSSVHKPTGNAQPRHTAAPSLNSRSQRAQRIVMSDPRPRHGVLVALCYGPSAGWLPVSNCV